MDYHTDVGCPDVGCPNVGGCPDAGCPNVGGCPDVGGCLNLRVFYRGLWTVLTQR